MTNNQYWSILERARVQSSANYGDRDCLQWLKAHPEANYFVADETGLLGAFQTHDAAVDFKYGRPLRAPVKHPIAGVGHFEISGDCTLVYSKTDDLLLNLTGTYTPEQMAEFISREFPNGLTVETADAWLDRP